MMNEAEVYFALRGGDFDPDVVTHTVGVAPTSACRKGAPAPKCTVWKISVSKVVGDLVDVYELSSALVSKLLPSPAIGFESEVITFLNVVGASIDIDTYSN